MPKTPIKHAKKRNTYLRYGRYLLIKHSCKTNEGDRLNTKKNRERELTYEGENTHHEQSEET